MESAAHPILFRSTAALMSYAESVTAIQSGIILSEIIEWHGVRFVSRWWRVHCPISPERNQQRYRGE